MFLLPIYNACMTVNAAEFIKKSYVWAVIRMHAKIAKKQPKFLTSCV